MSALSDIATHTRASSATYVDSDGVLQTVAIDVPRVGHHLWNGTAWVDAGYFHESEARTNLIAYSEDLSQWTSINSVLSSTTAPDGTSNATILTDDASGGSNTASVRVTAFTITAIAHTYSVFAKADQTGIFSLCLQGFATTTRGATTFDVSSGTVLATSANHTSGIQNCGNGWYRCWITFTGDAADLTGNYYLALADEAYSSTIGNPDTVTMDGSNSVAFFGAQFEAGSTPSSYIPTAGSSLTRAKDEMTIPAANLPWPTEAPLAVSIQMSGTMTFADTGVGAVSAGGQGEAVFFLWKSNDSNYINDVLTTASTQTGRPVSQQKAVGVEDFVLGNDTEYSPGINVPFNIASRHGSTFINGAVDGTALTANTTPTALPDLSATDMQIGYDFMGTIDLFRVWKSDITDVGIAEAST